MKKIEFKGRLFETKEDKLICRNKEDMIIFEKKITNEKIKKSILSPDNLGIIILITFEKLQERLHENLSGSDLLKALFKIDFNGNVMWYAETFTSWSRYFDLELKDNKIVAYDTAGYDCEIDATTGKIVSKKFVK